MSKTLKAAVWINNFKDHAGIIQKELQCQIYNIPMKNSNQ